MAKPSNSRLTRVAIIIAVLGALIWIVALVGISISSKQTSEKTPDPVATGANPG